MLLKTLLSFFVSTTMPGRHRRDARHAPGASKPVPMLSFRCGGLQLQQFVMQRLENSSMYVSVFHGLALRECVRSEVTSPVLAQEILEGMLATS